MKIEIGKKIKEIRKNCYWIEYKYLIGDTEAYDVYYNHIAPSNPFLINYLNFLTSIQGEQSEDISDDKVRNFIVNRYKSMLNSLDKVDNPLKHLDEIEFEIPIPNKETYYYMGFKITYFNSKGEQFEVNLVHNDQPF